MGKYSGAGSGGGKKTKAEAERFLDPAGNLSRELEQSSKPYIVNNPFIVRSI